MCLYFFHTRKHHCSVSGCYYSFATALIPPFLVSAIVSSSGNCRHFHMRRHQSWLRSHLGSWARLVRPFHVLLLPSFGAIFTRCKQRPLLCRSSNIIERWYCVCHNLALHSAVRWYCVCHNLVLHSAVRLYFVCHNLVLHSAVRLYFVITEHCTAQCGVYCAITVRLCVSLWYSAVLLSDYRTGLCYPAIECKLYCL